MMKITDFYIYSHATICRNNGREYAVDHFLKGKGKGIFKSIEKLIYSIKIRKNNQVVGYYKASSINMSEAECLNEFYKTEYNKKSMAEQPRWIYNF